MGLNYKFEFDIDKINKKNIEKFNKIKPIFTQEILKELNYHSPKLTGNLIGSSFLASDFKNGKIIYNTKYANYVHNSPKVRKISTRINKNAKKQWVLYSYSKYKKIWIEKLKKLWKMI